MAGPLVAACVSSHTGPEWTWLAEPLREQGVECRFFYLKPGAPAAPHGWAACWRAVALARQTGGVLVTHGVPAALRCAAIQRTWPGRRAPHVAWSWHHASSIPRRKRWLSRALAGAIDTFVVHSGLEAEHQARLLGAPQDKFAVWRWPYEEGARLSLAAPPPVEGDYVCTIGASARDYATLFAAMERLPDVQLVAALRPSNVRGLRPPPNVRLHFELPKAQSWELVRGCRVFVLPLLGREARTGHSCLGQAMAFGRPIVTTESLGLAEYLRPGETALTVPPGDAQALARALRALWGDPARASALGDAARSFARDQLSEHRLTPLAADLLRRAAGRPAARPPTPPTAALDPGCAETLSLRAGEALPSQAPETDGRGPDLRSGSPEPQAARARLACRVEALAPQSPLEASAGSSPRLGT